MTRSALSFLRFEILLVRRSGLFWVLFLIPVLFSAFGLFFQIFFAQRTDDAIAGHKIAVTVIGTGSFLTSLLATYLGATIFSTPRRARYAKHFVLRPGGSLAWILGAFGASALLIFLLQGIFFLAGVAAVLAHGETPLPLLVALSVGRFLDSLALLSAISIIAEILHPLPAAFLTWIFTANFWSGVHQMIEMSTRTFRVASGGGIEDVGGAADGVLNFISFLYYLFPKYDLAESALGRSASSFRFEPGALAGMGWGALYAAVFLLFAMSLHSSILARRDYT